MVSSCTILPGAKLIPIAPQPPDRRLFQIDDRHERTAGREVHGDVRMQQAAAMADNIGVDRHRAAEDAGEPD
jgi:hypothetical protein